MKKFLFSAVFALFVLGLSAQDQKPVQLNEHTKVRGTSVMEALQNRKSNRAFETTELSLQDLSDLLWAANGINRPESGKRTAPSAINSQDVDIFVCRADGSYVYDAVSNSLKPVSSQDIRPLLDRGRPSGAPLILLLVSDLSRYKSYKPESKESNKNLSDMSALDAGIVSQNIGIFCAGIGLGTVPRAGMDQDGVRKVLLLKDSQIPWLNHPIGFPKK